MKKSQNVGTNIYTHFTINTTLFHQPLICSHLFAISLHCFLLMNTILLLDAFTCITVEAISYIYYIELTKKTRKQGIKCFYLKANNTILQSHCNCWGILAFSLNFLKIQQYVPILKLYRGVPLFRYSITLKLSFNEILDLQKIELCPIKLKLKLKKKKKKNAWNSILRKLSFKTPLLGFKTSLQGFLNLVQGNHT